MIRLTEAGLQPPAGLAAGTRTLQALHKGAVCRRALNVASSNDS